MGLVVPQHVESSLELFEPLSPELAGRFLTTGPPGKSLNLKKKKILFLYAINKQFCILSIAIR